MDDRVVVTLKAGREPVTGAQLLDKALRQAGAGKIGAAIDTLQRAVRADPANPQIHYNLGVAFLTRKDVDAASIAFVRALGLSPTPSANLLLAVGNIARGRGAPGRARRFYERARQQDPRSALVTRNLEAVLAETGEMDGAIEAFRHSLECDPNAAETHLGLAMALAARGRVWEAEQSYREAIARAGDDGPVASAARDDLRAMGVDVSASTQPQAAGARQAGSTGGNTQPALLPATMATR
jgi:Flp pilus assembly protein TadD